ncbi:PREDICTED: zona pellucida-like domain-containing protein 1 [Poecilia mexicana]|uniref:zona pellucida-like domain-containing protein 1 n=1 Tax=Poecilia mexicana TaxID=48701 RepID=UPI00072E5205|nr:PREDICTED: zona pellucida-like domain-containing protein 1 [Poecilia mexicana]XP_014862946.1 PREDICTED: zona pellucida-like domain-containing protein 1 [Poecilia mexicana]XP_014862948.1 PREDICTED: zona pellucida-like domain-containing protein 1 [Poecilia mexicana]
MDLFLCLPLLAVFLQPALCVYNCSTMYERTPDNSDLTIECGTTMITVEVNLCTALWAGFNSSNLALNGNHNNTACLGSVDESVEPPIIRYHLPVNNSLDNSCRQSLHIVDEAPDPSGPFSSFSSIQTVIISSYIDTPKTDAGIISYSTDLYYYFSCRYPLEYLINNTQIVASSVSVATTQNNGSFIETLKMGVFNDTDYRHPLTVPSTGLELRTKVYVEVKAVNLTGNFHVLLDHCFATPSPYNMTQTDQYNFFTGCQVSARTVITSNGLSNVAQFNFEAFRFVQHRDQERSTIYLHCILRLCEPTKCQEVTNICNARRKRSLTPFGEESSDSATVSVGPLYTAAADVPEAAGSTGNTVASGSAGVDASSLVVWLTLGSVVAALLPDMATGLS